MKPTRGYTLSAGFLATTMAAPVGYAMLGLNLNPWIILAASLALAAALTAYSSLDKSPLLLKLNWLLLPALPIALIALFLAIDFNSVGEFLIWLPVLLVMSLGLPVFLFAIALGLHMWACLAVGKGSQA